MAQENPNARLEAFCDGVFAIAITLLIIDIRIPSFEKINSTPELLHALNQIIPGILIFLLSFIVIFITWVNHHAAMKLVHGTSAHFVYANGVLLLSVVFIPFPTSLVGDFILTDHAGPAVSLYCGVMGLQAVSWMLMTRAALNPSEPLITNEKSRHTARTNLKRTYFAIVLYFICAIIAFWLPLAIAILVAITWIVWLINGVGIKER